MLPRGEVGLIFATIGLREGVLGENLYAALLLVVVLATTLAAPPLLRWRGSDALRRRRAHRARPGAPTPPGAGWSTRDGVVDVAGRRPTTSRFDIAFEAALGSLADASPGPAAARLARQPRLTTPLRWDDAATGAFFDVLRRATCASWRFLETTGVLERALPELAEAVERRRADPFVVDPRHVLRF